MKRNTVRAIAMLWLMLALVIPAGIGAQEATPAASPVGTSPALGGDLGAAAFWLMDQQNDDGSFSGFSGEPDAGTTVDAVIALVAAEQQGVDTGTSIDDAIAYLASGDVALVYEQIGVGQSAKLVLALVAVGENPADFVTTNPLAIVQNGQDAGSGIYGTGIYDHAYALLALAATGSEIPSTALDALANTQTDNGGWAFDASTDPTSADSNTTAMVIQALVATGHADDAMVENGLAFLLTVLNDEGGAGYSQGAEPDANSTALVAQALIATQGDAFRPLASLQQFQLPSGAYFYQYADTSENLFSTLQVIPALAGVAFPVMPASSATPVAAVFSLAA